MCSNFGSWHFKHETQAAGIQYPAVDEGIMVKTGAQVMVSVRNAIGGIDLGKLHQSVENEFVKINETERNVRNEMAKMESGLIYTLQKFGKQ